MTGGLDEHTSALLTAVEQQLTRYFASISRQVDAQKVATIEAIDGQRRANGEYQEALRQALEERLTAFAQHQHERTLALEDQVDALAATPGAAADLTGITSRLEATERTLVDRLLAVEQRVSDEFGRRLASLEAVVGRVNSGFDEAIGALSQRMLELDNRLAVLAVRTDELAARQLSVDPLEINSLRNLATGAAGEATLLRMDLERLTSTASEHFDHYSVRIADIENTLQGEADVNSTVQLERLNELERQVSALDLTGIGRPANTARPAAPETVEPAVHAPTRAAQVLLPGPPLVAAAIPEPIIVEPVMHPPVFTLPEPLLAFDTRTVPTAVPEPVAAAPTSPLLAGLVAATPVTAINTVVAPSANDTTEVPVLRAPALTRRMAAPPPMTLTPRLPAANLAADNGSTGTEPPFSRS